MSGITGTAATISTQWPAIAMFVAIVGLTIALTIVAAVRTRTRADYYVAGAGISPLKNGIAIAGDFLSAAAFLGISALIYSGGFAGLIYALGFLTGWPVVLFLMAERLRNLGQYTFADAAAFHLDPVPVRLIAAAGSLTVIIFYLAAQMIGGGKVIQLLFGIDYGYAVAGVTALMLLYVVFGGMKATTWIQITKASLLLFAGTLMSIMVLWRFDFSFGRLLANAVAVHPHHAAILRPGSQFSDPLAALSLGVSLVFGTAGLPHILMRFFTVRDGSAARQSVFYATTFIAYFCLVIPLLGFAAIAILMPDARYFTGGDTGGRDLIGGLIGGANMATIHLADAIGGSLLLGFVSAVAFATILAVVAGLALAGASAVSHDIYRNVIARGNVSEATELRVSRLAAMALGVIAAMLAYGFQHQNVAFMVSLALSVAASCNFPILIMTLFWRGTTTRGVVAGGLLGLVSATVLILLSDTVWTALLGLADPPMPIANPALFSMTLAFAGIWLFSVTDRSMRADAERNGFDAQLLRSELGDRAVR
ncbi:MAG TPA: cation acetate symporter [Sphingobium sp.]